jgi:WD40 repeat protein
MSRAELEAAVRAPAKEVGLTFEPVLLERILDDVGDAPGNLPLLEFVLKRLWETRHRGRFMHEAYQQIGGLHGAVAARAEEVFGALTTTEQQDVRRVFLQLVRPGTATEDTRRRSTFTEIGEASQAVVKKLVDARLLVTTRDHLTGEGTVEVSHEALIRNWRRLKGWLDEDREFLLWRERLGSAVFEWHLTSRDEGALMRGVPLEQAQRFLAERSEEFTAHEREYVEASIGLREREKLASEEAQRELQEAYARVEQQRTMATARHLAAQAELALRQHGHQLQRGVLLAIESLRSIDSLQANQALRAGLAVLPQQLARMNHETGVWQVIFHPSGKHLATMEGKTAHVWKVPSCKEVARFAAERSGAHNLAFSKDGRFFAFVADGTVVICNGENYAELARISPAKGASSTALSPDGAHVATAEYDGNFQIWESATGEEIIRLKAYCRFAALCFSPDGRYLAARGGGFVIAWETDTYEELFSSLVGDSPYMSDQLVFSPDSTKLATNGDEGGPVVLDVRTGRVLIRVSHEVTLHALCFSPDGRSLASAGRNYRDEDFAVRLWETTKGREFARFAHAASIWAARFSPDGRYLATGSGDNTARVWDVTSRREIVRMNHEDRVQAVSFSPDGKTLATASLDGSARIWGLTGFPDSGQVVHEDVVWQVCFSPDGTYLASASKDRTVRIRNMQSGREIARFKHTNNVRDMIFSPDGAYLATRCADGTARVRSVGDRRLTCLIRRVAKFAKIDNMARAKARIIRSSSTSSQPTVGASGARTCHTVIVTHRHADTGVRLPIPHPPRPPQIAPINALN